MSYQRAKVTLKFIVVGGGISGMFNHRDWHLVLFNANYIWYYDEN